MKRLALILLCAINFSFFSAGCVKPSAFYAPELDEARSGMRIVSVVTATAGPLRKDAIYTRSGTAGAAYGVLE